jgi:hypothetical protein
MTDTPINVAYSATEDLHLRIALAACRFKAEPGEGEAWITVTYHDPTAKRLPRIVEEGGPVRISEGGQVRARLLSSQPSSWTSAARSEVTLRRRSRPV